MGDVTILNTFHLWELSRVAPDLRAIIETAPGNVDIEGRHVYKPLLDHVDIDGHTSERGVLFMKLENTMDPHVARVDVPHGLRQTL